MNTSKPRTRATPFLAMGLAFLPIGIATRQVAFLTVGLAFLAIALVLFARRPTP